MSGGLERQLIRRLLEAVGRPRLAIESSTGEQIHVLEGDEAPVAVVRLHDNSSLLKLLTRPEKTFGELYSRGVLTIDGDLVATLNAIDQGVNRAAAEAGGAGKLVRKMLKGRLRANTVSASKENIHTHYDLGNDFYALWLDREYMQYTCAFYPDERASLEQAQIAKLDLVCRKLDLKPGDKVVEAGSGWGGLARYMARHYGATVRSYNISSEQVAWARRQADKEGLGNAIEFVEDDYRNISGSYDAFVSVGMLEHVGVDNFHALGKVIDSSLTDDGRGLIHTIGRPIPKRMNEWIESYIFPGGYPPTLGQMMEIFEPSEFIIMDVENLRSHYARTITHWLERYEENAERVRELFDDNFVNAWRLYLSGSISAFSQGQLQLFQVLFQRDGSTRLPYSRDRMFGAGQVDRG